MMSALIVSSQADGNTAFSELLTRAGFAPPVICRSCSEARRMLIDRSFDLIIVNTPLSDETGEKFACDAADGLLSSVILIVKGKI